MATSMLRNILGIVVLLSLTGVDCSLAQNRVQQELKRVSELLQHLETADQQNKLLDAGTEHPEDRSSNPFAAKSSVVGSKSEPPSVSVDPNEIRIHVNGQDIRIDRSKPRVNETNSESSSSPGIADNVLQSLNEPALQKAKIYQKYAVSMAGFNQGHYAKAKTLLEKLEDSIANEAVVSQTYALILFQTGDFPKAAEWAYSSLNSDKPFDWNTIQGMYGHPADYASRYQELQTACRRNPERIELHFLLAYHHLMLGHREHSQAELKIVAASLEADPIVQKLIQMAGIPDIAPPQPISD